MTRFYVRFLEDDGTPARLDPVGPYKDEAQARLMRITYESLLKKKAEVIEQND